MEITLANGRTTIVDDADYERLSQYRWSTTNCGHVQGTINGKHVYMHRVIMDAKQGQEIDHIDRNKTNNRRANLRVVTHSENLKNVDYTSRHAAGNPVYATWEKRCNKWRAYQYLRKDDGKRKQIYLGVFSSKDEALACPPAQKHS